MARNRFKLTLQKKIILTIVVILLIFCSGILIVLDAARCNHFDYLNTSLQVETEERKLVGFNLDKDSVTLGTVSTGAIAERAVFSEYSKKATARVWLEGEDKDFISWTSITPNKFKVIPNEKQEVKIKAQVPDDAKVGNYTAKIIFCYNNK
ncbi:MAG: hypothetical protein KKA62_03230 [Nanoarchaeota archaeon]|nr:hypothetical protein [Nanoarchaeota archaeon]